MHRQTEDRHTARIKLLSREVKKLLAEPDTAFNSLELVQTEDSKEKQNLYKTLQSPQKKPLTKILRHV